MRSVRPGRLVKGGECARIEGPCVRWRATAPEAVTRRYRSAWPSRHAQTATLSTAALSFMTVSPGVSATGTWSVSARTKGFHTPDRGHPLHGAAGLGQPGHPNRRGAFGVQRRSCLKRLCEAPVRLRALAGKQIPEHSLADQLMPEGIAVGVCDQHVGGPGRPQPGSQRSIITPCRGRQQCVAHPGPAHGRGPQQLLGLFRQVLNRAEQQLAQRPRKIGADRPVGVQQGLGVQGFPPPRSYTALMIEGTGGGPRMPSSWAAT